MKIVNANVYRNDARCFEKKEIWIENGIIRAVEDRVDRRDETLDADGAWLVPGLIDVHTHGRRGLDFVTCQPAELGTIAADYARHGVTTVMPTLASAPYEQMLAMTDAINRHTAADGEATFCGVHWEGRYINLAKRGAHAPACIAPLRAEELTSEVFRMCRALHISAAYELDADGSFAEQARKLGATLGLAHTMATYADAKTLETRGVTAYTHLFNAMPPLHHRDGGAVCAALEGDAFAELICDGIHVSPEMVRLAFRLKGAERICLISDSIEAAGMPDGHYHIAGLPTVVQNGIARTEDNGVLAGSTLCLDTAVRNLMDFCRIPLTEAILCATETPARQMGVFDSCGSLEAGKRADILFLKSDRELTIDRVMVRGRCLTSAEG